MFRYILIALSFLFVACNNHNATYKATSKNPDSTFIAGTKTDPAKRILNSIDKVQLQENHAQNNPKTKLDSSLDAAENIVHRMPHFDSWSSGHKNSVTLNKKYNIEEMESEGNGFLIKAQRDNAIFDKYLSIGSDMDEDAPRPNMDSLKKFWNGFNSSLKDIVAYLKNNPGTQVEVLDYLDLRYGQMCNILEPVRAEMVISYLLSQGADSTQFIAAGFGWDEPYTMTEDHGIFKKGDKLTQKYISKLSEGDQQKAYDFLRTVQLEVILLPPKT